MTPAYVPFPPADAWCVTHGQPAGVCAMTHTSPGVFQVVDTGPIEQRSVRARQPLTCRVAVDRPGPRLRLANPDPPLPGSTLAAIDEVVARVRAVGRLIVAALRSRQ